MGESIDLHLRICLIYTAERINTMLQDEVIQYLANIMKVVQADKILEPREEVVYATICKEIGAKKKEINEAEKLANNDDFSPAPIGRFSNKIRNVEDMILVSLADGKIGATQEQINTILFEAKQKTKKDDPCSICAGCKKEMPSISKFCPECGISVQTDTKKGQQLEFNYPAKGISIEFAESTSASFHEAKSNASKAPDFQKCIRNKKLWYLATWGQNQILEALRYEIKISLHQKGNANENKDGMDIALCVLNIKTNEMQFAGAYNPIYIIKNEEEIIENGKLKIENEKIIENGKLKMENGKIIENGKLKIENEKIIENGKLKIENEKIIEKPKSKSQKPKANRQKPNLITIKADRQPISIYLKERPFTNHEFQVQKDDIIYLFSDGYADQFGGEKVQKFMNKNLKNLLLSISDKPMSEQYKILAKTFEDWQGYNKQIDDVLVMGVKI